MLNSNCLLLLYFISVLNGLQAQDSVVKKSILDIKYFSINNKIQYLLIQSKIKAGKKYTPVKNVPVGVFIDSDSGNANLLDKTITGENGEVKVILPESAKALWDASAQHNFIAIATATKDPITARFDDIKTELQITKSKISIDTSSDEGTRTIAVTVTELKDGKWMPAKEVEMKIGIRRLSSILSAGDEETYTTDSIGQVLAEFKKGSLPGDEKGNIMLVAKVEDNELYGNLVVEKSVPWGVYIKPENNANRKTLWTTGDKVPTWLLFMAVSLAGGVWSVLIYLVFRLLKIRKLGRAAG